MTKINTGTAVLFSMFGLLLLGMLFFMFAPQSASAAVSSNAFLGGGNAFSRATLGQSQGLTNANPASDLFTHLTLASTRGGRAEEVPPENGEENNSGGNSANGETGTNGLPAQAGDAGAQAGNGGNPSTGSGQANGGAVAGNGGDGAEGGGGGNGGSGGDSSLGGLVRAGSVVSNATALNMINVNIVRINTR